MTLHAAANVLAVNPLDPKSLLKWAGEWALWIVIFAETGLLIGFFLPGDTLLFLAGVASSPIATALVGTHLSITPLLIVTPLVAFAGAQLGYLIGGRFGVALFDKPNSRIFKREYVDKTEAVFDRFGNGKAVVLGRFIPVVRTFLNPAAAILEMPVRRFMIFNIVGAIIWTDAILLLGHSLANEINKTIGADNIDKYILGVVILIVLIAAAPLLFDLFRRQRAKRRAGTAPATDEPAAPSSRPASHRR